jgi:predicted  nucleic acid-binding Zn-ribbon protein
MQQSRKAREGEKEELKAELEVTLSRARGEVATLGAELASREKWISKLEKEVKETRRRIVKFT